MVGNRHWNARELAILKFYYPDPTLHIEEVAELVGRPAKSVYHKATRLGLKRDHTPSMAYRVPWELWPDWEALRKVYNADEAATVLGVQPYGG